MNLFTCCKKKRKLHFHNFTDNKLRGSPWPILSAHRGGSYERAENTASAFKNAVRTINIG